MPVRSAAAVVVVVIASVAGLSVTAGCEREEEIRSYQAPRDVPPPSVTPRASPPSPPALAAAEQPTFDVPASWSDVSGGEQSLRFAAYQVSQADPNALVTVIPLGRESGDLLPNVVRWAGQVDVPPPRQEDLPNVTQQVDINGLSVTLVDLTGPRLRTLAAIVPRGERVWFIKLTGNTQTVEAEKQSFDAMVRSIRFERQVPDAPSTPPAPQTRQAPLDDAVASTAAPRWQVPEGWVQDADRPMRFATFRTADDSNAPEVIVSTFGAFGTMEDNINRWRGMVGLEPVKDVNEQPVERIEIDGREGALFDMTGPGKDGQPALRLVLAMVPVDRSVWFFRMTGNAHSVEQQKANFEAFMRSIKFES